MCMVLVKDPTLELLRVDSRKPGWPHAITDRAQEEGTCECARHVELEGHHEADIREGTAGREEKAMEGDKIPNWITLKRMEENGTK